MNTDIVELFKRPRWIPLVEHTVYEWVSSDETCGLGRIQVYAEPKGDIIVNACADNAWLNRIAIIP